MAPSKRGWLRCLPVKHGLLLLPILVGVVKPLPAGMYRSADEALVAGDLALGVELHPEADGSRRMARAAPVVPRRGGSDGGDGRVSGAEDGEETVVREPWEINQGLCPPPLAHLCRISVPGPNGRMQDTFVTPFFEGDIVLDWEDRRRQGLANMKASSLRIRDRRPRRRRAIVKGNNLRWSNGVIPYTIDEEFSNDVIRLLKSAMRHWQNRTCIRFVPKKRSDRDYLRFGYFPGCWSFVGKHGGEQLISMGPGCSVFGTIVHELGHAIGFWHEQGRRDRDMYVQIVHRNIAPGTEENFGKIDAVNVTSQGYPYDFDSIMHYSSTSFSTNGKPTIRMKKKYRHVLPLSRLGLHEEGLSDLDVAQTRNMYHCNQKDARKRKRDPCFQSEAGDGREYRGDVDYTESGVTCQRWTSQYPHEHGYVTDDDERNERRGIGDHNKCRNPGGRRERPWCFTTLKKKIWEYCDIKLCSTQN
ncbi:zinc metalloproteinase nas-6-like [Diadema antillarum]|uniref:zinc metalloproteinase nas-6-like n=1 Tax=Diadema antillarum TaxID=105358 RepID=UPI003A8C4795